MNARNTKPVLFLMLSAALHGLLLFAWQMDSENITVAASAAPLTMTLATPPSPLPQQPSYSTVQPGPATPQDNTSAQLLATKKSPRPAAQHATRTMPRPAPVVQARPEQRPATKNMARQAQQTALQTPHAPDRTVASSATVRLNQQRHEQLGARIQQQLRMKIAFNNHYPRIAVRNAWEGRVRLGIRVQANGDLTGIRVINSSGHRILDRAAVKSVQHIAVLPEAGLWLQGQSIDVILPVIYTLTDS